MCDLVSGLMVASTVVSGVGQYQAAQAQANAAEYQAEVDRRNAILEENRARDAQARGKREEDRLRQEGEQIRGAQEAGFAANNIDLSYGSPLDTMLATAAAVESDALTIRDNARRESEDAMRSAWNFRTNSQMREMEADNARTAGRIGALGTVLSGGAKTARWRAQYG